PVSPIPPPPALNLFPYTTLFRSDAGLTTNATYGYRVRAKKDDGFSDYSNAATAVIVGTPPAAPSGTMAAPGSSTVVIVYWSDNSDRKSTRLNSSHVEISYAVFCL